MIAAVALAWACTMILAFVAGHVSGAARRAMVFWQGVRVGKELADNETRAAGRSVAPAQAHSSDQVFAVLRERAL